MALFADSGTDDGMYSGVGYLATAGAIFEAVRCWLANSAVWAICTAGFGYGSSLGGRYLHHYRARPTYRA